MITPTVRRSVLAYAVAAVCALTAAAVAAPNVHRFAGREEDGNGSRERRVAAPGVLKAPVLRGFSFSREFVNKNIEQMSLVLHPERGTLDAVFTDDSPRARAGKFNWEARYAEVAQGSAQRAAGFCARGQCTQLIRVPADKAFVLSGFYFRFQNGDHHLKKVEIMEARGSLQVTFADKKPDDPYNWVVYYTLVDHASLRTSVVTGTARGSTTKTLPPLANTAEELVLTGFSLEFKEGDHEIRELGIVLEAARALIKYNDKNADDAFDYVVRYAWMK
jgi:hypothetical protein